MKQTLCLLLVSGALGFGGALVFAAPEIEFEADAPWKESQQALPPYPQDADLIELKLDGPGTEFDYRIDTKSLLSGADGVVHYTVILTSRSGVINVLREGLRCATKQYKTYGYGTPELTLVALEKTEWRKIEGQGHAGFRRELMNYYLCDSLRIPLQPVQILKRLEHPPSFSSPRDPRL